MGWRKSGLGTRSNRTPSGHCRPLHRPSQRRDSKRSGSHRPSDCARPHRRRNHHHHHHHHYHYRRRHRHSGRRRRAASRASMAFCVQVCLPWAYAASAMRGRSALSSPARCSSAFCCCSGGGRLVRRMTARKRRGGGCPPRGRRLVLEMAALRSGGWRPTRRWRGQLPSRWPAEAHSELQAKKARRACG